MLVRKELQDMELSRDIKKYIDGLSYAELYLKWHHKTKDDPLFQGESGEYATGRIKTSTDNSSPIFFLEKRVSELERAVKDLQRYHSNC